MPTRIKEDTVKDRIKAILEENEVWYCMPPANGYGKMGNFDFIACVDGAFLGIEAKRDDKETPTQLQTDNAEAARASGAVILLLHKDNLPLLTNVINVLRLRLLHMPCSINTGLCSWPPAKPPEDDRNVKLIKKVKK